MIRFRAVESYADSCSLPSPHRIPCCVAGMAFNFSKIELAPPAAQRNQVASSQAQPGPAASARAEARSICFGTPQSSVAR